MNKLFKWKTPLFIHQLLLIMVIVLLSNSLSAQDFGNMEVDNSIESGIIVPVNSPSDIGVIQFKIDNLTKPMYESILRELNKYNGEIVNCGAKIEDKKLIVSYVSPTYPNFILAILDRVNISGYYDVNGVDTYYFKDGYSAFIR